MKIKTITAKLIYFSRLSEAIQQELKDADIVRRPCNKGYLFWAKSPSSIVDMNLYPNWYAFCREEDLKANEQIIIEI